MMGGTREERKGKGDDAKRLMKRPAQALDATLALLASSCINCVTSRQCPQKTAAQEPPDATRTWSDRGGCFPTEIAFCSRVVTPAHNAYEPLPRPPASAQASPHPSHFI